MHRSIFVCSALLLLALPVFWRGCAKEQETAEQEAAGPEESTMQQEEYAPDCIVRWAIPEGMTAVSDETAAAVNRKLREDGFPFGLEIVLLEEENYAENLRKADADIAFIGWDDDDANHAATVLDNGEYECLDRYLEGSALYEAMPEILWDGVRYKGSVYYVPNETAQDTGCCVFFKDQVPDELVREFDGDVMELEESLSEERQMKYGISGFLFLWVLGYAFDPMKGVLVTEDGECMNPLEVEECVQWMRTMNRWYAEGKITDDPRGEDSKACAVVLTSGYGKYQDRGWREYTWKAYAFQRLDGSTGIRASSARKDEAFRMLELFHTDHSYGNLLVYGKDYTEWEEPAGVFFMNRFILGLDTGLRWGEQALKYFSGEEEKKKFYEEHVLPSPSLYMEFPKECAEIRAIEEKYDKIIFSKDFENELREFQEELKEPMDRVLPQIKRNQ